MNLLCHRGKSLPSVPGVHIGDGAFIGKGAVVGSDIPPYSIAVGNPAKVVRKRFDDELIALLERTKWWDLPVEEIQALIPVLTNSDLEGLKAELKKRNEV